MSQAVASGGFLLRWINYNGCPAAPDTIRNIPHQREERRKRKNMCNGIKKKVPSSVQKAPPREFMVEMSFITK